MKPSQMLLDGHVQEAPYQLLLEADTTTELAPDSAVPLSVWLARVDAGQSIEGIGVIVSGDEDIAPLQAHLERVPFVALHLPKFTDGRMYSHARRLRSIWGYERPLVVFGDVLRDQLLYMSRVGINAFYMREDQSLEASRAAFQLYSQFYQYN